jgi:hypothetical protein
MADRQRSIVMRAGRHRPLDPGFPERAGLGRESLNEEVDRRPKLVSFNAHRGGPIHYWLSRVSLDHVVKSNRVQAYWLFKLNETEIELIDNQCINGI